MTPFHEIRGDLFAFSGDAIGIPINGAVKASGAAVMGRGVAFQAACRWPSLPRLVGQALRTRGLRTTVLTQPWRDDDHALTDPEAHAPGVTALPYALVAVPVKPARVVSDGQNIIGRVRDTYPPGRVAPGWHARADLGLIDASARDLVALADAERWSRVALPRLGCGNGERRWSEVRAILWPILDDRFTVVDLRA